jgi:hypothetical protein
LSPEIATVRDPSKSVVTRPTGPESASGAGATERLDRSRVEGSRTRSERDHERGWSEEVLLDEATRIALRRAFEYDAAR